MWGMRRHELFGIKPDILPPGQGRKLVGQCNFTWGILEIKKQDGDFLWYNGIITKHIRKKVPSYVS